MGVPAQATEGYFMPGYSAPQKAMAGAGVANPEDAMTLATNPAGIASVREELEIGVSLFSPDRQYTATGPGFVAPGGMSSGSVTSRNKFFLVPGVAYNHPIDENTSWGVAMYANGGMNTDYPAVANASCPPGYSGVFCGGKAGVNLNQMFVSAGYAWKSGALSLGIAPTLVMQMFSANGLALFGMYGLSSDPTNLSDRGISYSYGGGVRAGAIWAVTPNLRLAVSGSTPMWMSKFTKYKGLFAGGGSFDIPASLTAGVAWDTSPNLTLMVDYKHIFYGGVEAVANSSENADFFGKDDGPGFGWKDVDVISVGAAFKLTPDCTLRAGYAHNNNPIDQDDVTMNILAPGVVTDHFSAGISHRLTEHSVLDFAAMYVPTHSISGTEVTPMGPNPYRTIKLSMSEMDFTIGYRYQF
ncbi:MAG: outer membrane protein transport protein [Alphaproteobacteria bacterium]|nr:outer membrane protein transport protein [Alphaproteobacteria bacterium]MDE2111114.1 outer membrane protein transport protein [Alphaproteobacteria bacterium]MDE2495932.1 outer membrane protein transport protein [Alphaproteobacteria bacterium]